MASASVTEVFNCTVDDFFKLITDYEKYPEFLPEVKGIRILEEQGNKKLVEFTISVIKNFKYNLWLTEHNTDSVAWEFAGGDIFKQMSGHWKLADEAGKCRATYGVEAKMGLLVPGAITKTIIEVNLPNMISAYHKRVKELYGK